MTFGTNKHARAAASLLIMVLPGSKGYCQNAPNSTAPAGNASNLTPITAAVIAQASKLDRIMLSPDGKYVSVAVTNAGEQALTILDAASRAHIQTLALPKLHDLAWYRWAGSGKIVLKLTTRTKLVGSDVRIAKLMVFDLAARKLSSLGPPKLPPFDDMVIHADPDGRYLLVSVRKDLLWGPEVRRYELDGREALQSNLIEPAKYQVWQWVADRNGVVRYGFGRERTRSIVVWYRDKSGEPLRRVADYPAERFAADSALKLAIDPNTSSAILFERGQDGHVVLSRRPLFDGGSGETLYSVPGGDVTDIDLDRSGKLASVKVGTDRVSTHWFIPELEKLQARIAKALGAEEVSIVSRAEDNSRMIVWSGSPHDPGSDWLYDLRTGEMAVFSEVMPGIDPGTTAVPQAVTYQARDGTPIRAYLTLPKSVPTKPRAFIVLPHGGPFDVRDYLRFDPLAQFLASRGYGVIQPNYRGSSGYGLDFVKLGHGQVGRAMQDDLDDAADWAVRQGYADPGRICLVGTNYGGYAALWGVIRNPERYRCGASLAGVTNLPKILKYDRRFLSSAASERFEAKFEGADDFDLAAVSPEQQIGRLTRPVLLVHGDEDVQVPFAQYEGMVAAARKAGKPLETLVLKGDGHSLRKSENKVLWLEALAKFLADHNPAN